MPRSIPIVVALALAMCVPGVAAAKSSDPPTAGVAASLQVAAEADAKRAAVLAGNARARATRAVARARRDIERAHRVVVALQEQGSGEAESARASFAASAETVGRRLAQTGDRARGRLRANARRAARLAKRLAQSARVDTHADRPTAGSEEPSGSDARLEVGLSVQATAQGPAGR